jgi:glycine/D-amino acid oxidase-like deaminating enzyme
VLCDGAGMLSAHFFPFLPFNINRGDILTVQSDIELPFVLNRGAWLIPLDNNQFKLGATYCSNTSDEVSLHEAENTLKTKINRILNQELMVLSHQSGVRPATRDRRPFIGTHPQRQGLHIFNGFGSKGTSLTPYFAHQFVESLYGKMSLDKEILISRYNNI